ncbi:MAG: energy transducer TonB, partial [Planctomycetaceae bacterium]
DRAEQNRDSVASRQSSGQLLQRLPRKLPRNPQPIYPADAWRLGREGRVVLHVRVDIQGRVRDARVHSSSGTRALDQAALEAVRRWKFRPALRGRRPVEHAVLVPVSFRIER